MDVYARGDWQQVDEIEGMVQRRTCGRIRDLRVEIHENFLVLSGRTQSYYAKQLAQQVALAAADCVLRNEIEVC